MAAESPSPRVDAGVYVDDRSDPVAVLRSYVNALNCREFARAYGYWAPGAAGCPTSAVRAS